MKDSYNCDALSLAAATAAMKDQDWMKANVARIRATRERLTSQLTAIGFQVVPSQANFVWATHPSREHKSQYEALRARKILVRYMAFPDVVWAPDQRLDGLRITIGTDPEVDALVSALKEII
jgi:histidinol-phosphate aminotransferase